MFENILHQDRVCESLRDDINGGRLPQSLLFAGPDYAGKLSAALELVRVLSCQTKGAPWGCTCASCTQQKHLLSPYVMMLGRRYFGREIRACGAALMTEDKDSTRFLLLRSVRKLLRRFDPILWEGDSKLSTAVKHIEKIEEKLEVLTPGKPSLPPAEIESALQTIFELAETLSGILPQEGISIAMVRRVTYWAHTADARQRKFILIENAEMMNESTRNSLLKVLEEPPPEVYFILLSSRKNAIMQTILSRVRPYSFAERGANEQEVLERIFRQTSGSWAGLRAFFVGMQPDGETLIRERSRMFAEVLLRRAGLGCLLPPGRSAELEEIVQGVTKDRDSLEDLVRLTVETLCDHLGRLDETGTIVKLNGQGLLPIQAADSIQGVIRRMQSLHSVTLSYNLAAASLLERVYFEAGSPSRS